MSEDLKRRGRKKKNQYWGITEEEAVKNFLSLGDIVFPFLSGETNSNTIKFFWTGTTKEERERNSIYRDSLKYPLEKMVESIIRKYKLYSKVMEYEDLHSDTLSFLMVKFHKFKPEKNKKSYSYYGTVCKHYLLGKLIKEDKKFKTQIGYDDVSSDIESSEEYSYEIDKNNDDLNLLIKNIVTALEEEIDNHILNDIELKVGQALISILNNWEVLFSETNGGNKFNKNLILYYMREITSLSTKDIRNGMKRYKVIYKLIKEDHI